MRFNSLLNTGIEHLGPAQSPYKVKVTNFVSIITSMIAASYLVYYWLVLDSILLGLLNFVFVIAYLMPLVFMHQGMIRTAKFWFFSVLMLHVLLLATLVMNRDAGIHFYYFLVPAGVFLFFERDQRKARLYFSGAAVVLFMLCEWLGDRPGLIPLSDEQARWLLRSTVIVCLLEVYIVMSVFTREIEQRENLLHHQASTDELTALANRRTLILQGDVHCERARRYELSLTLLLIDVDHFKQINDRYGHTTGDQVLVALADIMATACRCSDLVSRYGGEEFAILLPNTDQERAQQVADKVRLAVEAHQIDVGDGELVSCTISIGVASVEPQRTSFAQLLIAADRALYQAKQAGRNRIEVFNEDLPQSFI